MATNRPKIVIYSDERTLAKLQILAQNERRSVSNLCDLITHEYIKAYEAEHGTIEIEQ